MISPIELKQRAQHQIESFSSLEWLTYPSIAKANFAESEMPGRRTEAWKYTPLTPLQNSDYFLADGETAIDEHSARQTFEELQNVSRIVFINGRFHYGLSDFSDLENQGIATLFSNANESQRELINTTLGSVCDTRQHIFAALNYSQLDEGLLIQVPTDFRVEYPIHIVHLTTSANQSCHAPSRLLIIGEANSQFELIEQFDSLGTDLNVLANQVTEIQLHDNARLTHMRLQVEDESQLLINGLHIELGKGANYEQHAIALGGHLKRNDIHLRFSGEQAYSRLNGVFLSKHRQHIDNHLNLEHARPHGRSDTVYKGFVADQSRAVFNGRIHIHPHAQKTEAHLNNKNLLLSKQAELDTKPELEIYADDVQCSHGASIGQLDDKSLFYFQSRGIDHATAEAMLCLGFVNEMVREFPDSAVRQLIAKRLSRYFSDVDQLHGLWSMESDYE